MPLAISDWIPLVPAVLVATIVLWVPGLAVVAATTRLRVWTVAVAPAVTIGLIGVGGIAWGTVGVRWTLVPLIVFTGAVAAVAYAVRRLLRTGGGAETGALRQWTWFLGGVGVGGTLLAVQLIRVIGTPDAIAQRFDNIFHLNAIQHVLHSGDASSLGLADFTGNVFYQMGWHSLAALVAQLAGVGVPEAVSATNIAIAATAWTAGCAALVAVIRPHKAWLAGLAAVVAVGFGAFPYRLLDFGVLYPNFLSIAILPAVLALTLRVLGLPSTEPRTERNELAVRVLLLLVACAGLLFAQPNGLMTLLAMSTIPLVFAAVLRVRRLRAERGAEAARAVRLTIVLLVAALAAGAATWQFARPPVAAGRWAPEQGISAALQSGVTVAPPFGHSAWLIVTLVVSGLVAVVVKPRNLWAASPFAVAILLYTSASAFPADSAVREFMTGPYFHDTSRLAAVLPVGAVVMCAFGAELLVSWVDRVFTGMERRTRLRDGQGTRAVRVAGSVALAGVLIVGLTVANPNAADAITTARRAYVPGYLLSEPERELLEELPALVPEDALIAVNPHTGASFAFALANRTVTAPHIYFTPTEALEVLSESLDEINTDPEVCDAVRESGVDYVLDFGQEGVLHPRGSWSGFDDFEAGPHLELVATTGPQSRLFRVAC